MHLIKRHTYTHICVCVWWLCVCVGGLCVCVVVVCVCACVCVWVMCIPVHVFYTVCVLGSLTVCVLKCPIVCVCVCACACMCSGTETSVCLNSQTPPTNPAKPLPLSCQSNPWVLWSTHVSSILELKHCLSPLSLPSVLMSLFLSLSLQFSCQMKRCTTRLWPIRVQLMVA